MRRYTLKWDSRSLELGHQARIMGIVNITPDSFSDGGKYYESGTAVAHAEMLVRQGADIVDLGGESTRPFSERVDTDEELRRVIPVIESLSARITVPISIDTTKAVVARRALAAGASIINDISALHLDPAMADVAAEFNVPVVIMHMLGSPKTMQITPEYTDVVGDIKAFLEERITYATAAGIPRENLIIDPGIGFGKTLEHNLLLIKHLGKFQTLGAPLLIGPSRKAFIRNILKEESDKTIEPDQPEVELGTQAVVAASILQGAHIVRVHNVAATQATVRLTDAIKNV